VKRKTTVLLAIGFAVVVLAVLVFTTMGMNRYRCEVCIFFNGRQACRTAAASTEAQAMRAATENACAQIASGVTDSMACESTAPQSVVWLNRK
jgi:hypothetical protein